MFVPLTVKKLTVPLPLVVVEVVVAYEIGVNTIAIPITRTSDRLAVTLNFIRVVRFSIHACIFISCEAESQQSEFEIHLDSLSMKD